MHGGHLLVLYATRDDRFEISEIGVDVECKAMHRYPAAASDPHRTDLAFHSLSIRVDPNTRLSDASSTLEPVFGHRKDDDFFQAAQVSSDIREESFQVKDGIPNNLSGSVVSDITPAVGMVKRNTTPGTLLLIDEHMLHLTTLTKGIDGRMFTEQKVMFGVRLIGGGIAGRNRSVPFRLPVEVPAQQSLLQFPGGSVFDLMQVPEEYGLCRHGAKVVSLN